MKCRRKGEAMRRRQGRGGGGADDALRSVDGRAGLVDCWRWVGLSAVFDCDMGVGKGDAAAWLPLVLVGGLFVDGVGYGANYVVVGLEVLDEGVSAWGRRWGSMV